MWEGEQEQTDVSRPTCTFSKKKRRGGKIMKRWYQKVLKLIKKRQPLHTEKNPRISDLQFLSADSFSLCFFMSFSCWFKASAKHQIGWLVIALFSVNQLLRFVVSQYSQVFLTDHWQKKDPFPSIAWSATLLQPTVRFRGRQNIAKWESLVQIIIWVNWINSVVNY